MELSVIIVSYNAFDFLVKCLNSLQEFLPDNAEIIVFDNASVDPRIQDLPLKYPTIQFILNPENLGFAKGNNQAIKLSKGEKILILNPDTIVYQDFFPRLLSFASSLSDMGAIGVRMLDGNGDYLPESKRNIPTMGGSFAKLFSGYLNFGRGYYETDLKPTENGKVEILSGACMFLKKSVYEEMGGFDERYFMYGEDIDLSYSLLKKGYSNYYLGEIYITHFKGESTVKDHKYLANFYGAMKIFIEKYHKPKNLLLYYIMLAGLKLKYAMARFKIERN